MSRINIDLSSLRLSKRVENALRRAGIVSVAELQESISSGRLNNLWFIGPKAFQEINSSLIAIHSRSEEELSSDLARSQNGPQIEASVIKDTVADELLELLAPVNARDMQIILERFGLTPFTLEAIGASHGLTRERVRQIAQRYRKRVVQRFHHNATQAFTIRFAYTLAEKLDQTLTLRNWEQDVRNHAKVGQFSGSGLDSIDPYVVLVAVTNILIDAYDDSTIPYPLKCVLETARNGDSSMSVEEIEVGGLLTKTVRKLIKRHWQHSGAVNALWISQKTQLSLKQANQGLSLLGYKPSDTPWYVASSAMIRERINYHNVFQRGVRKMLQYCGPLSSDTLAAGLRKVNIKTQFPVPPPGMLESVLLSFGFTLKDDLIYWYQESTETLSQGEIIILDCLERNGPVVHHAELAEAFIQSDLSFASLHQTLKRSPVFDKIDHSLYKLRGQTVTYRDVDRARNASSSISQDPDVKYDRQGNIKVSLNIGLLTLGTGVIQISRTSFPNLTGKWDCILEGKSICVLVVTEGEFRHLEEPLRELECKAGDRLAFTFNTWDRTVTLNAEKPCHEVY